MTDFNPGDAASSLSGIFDEVVDTVSHVGEGIADVAEGGYHYGAGVVDDVMGDSSGADAQYAAGDSSVEAGIDQFGQAVGVDPILPPPPPPGTPPMPPIPGPPPLPPDLPPPDQPPPPPPDDQGTESAF
jgi:hypothetical protein